MALEFLDGARCITSAVFAAYSPWSTRLTGVKILESEGLTSKDMTGAQIGGPVASSSVGLTTDLAVGPLEVGDIARADAMLRT